MADLLQTGSDWLEGMRAEHATRSVTYHRGGDSVQVQATVGKTIFEIDNGYGILEKVESRDYLILTADLVINAQEILPQRGDQVKETVGNKTYTYEVMAPGKEPHYRFSDPYRKTLRIHTKQVDVETS